MGPKTRAVVEYVRAHPGACQYNTVMAVWGLGGIANRVIGQAIDAGFLTTVDGPSFVELWGASQCGQCGRSDHGLADALADGSMCSVTDTSPEPEYREPVSIEQARLEAERERDAFVFGPTTEESATYAWTVEDQINTGSLVEWCHDYENGHYSGVPVPTVVVRLEVNSWDGSGVPIHAVPCMVFLNSTGADDNDYLHYEAVIYDNGHVVDTAYVTIDGRA